MTSSADKYVKNVVNDTGDEEEIVDSDGEILGKNLRIRGQLQKIYSHTDCSHLYFSILSILLQCISYYYIPLAYFTDRSLG